jgi:hypothetical protein
LIGVSFLFVLMGGLVLGGGLYFMFLAGVLSSIATALGTKGVRYTALVVLAFAASGAVWTYPEVKRDWDSAWERSAITSVRNLVNSQSTYSDTTGSYAPDLEALSNEGLIDSVLASGTQDGYTFRMTVGSDSRTFTVNARPVTRSERTNRSFYSDQTEVIRYTKEDRPATVDDNPLGF